MYSLQYSTLYCTNAFRSLTYCRKISFFPHIIFSFIQVWLRGAVRRRLTDHAPYIALTHLSRHVYYTLVGISLFEATAKVATKL